MPRTFFTLALLNAAFALSFSLAAEPKPPVPLRPLPQPVDRPLEKGFYRYVDPGRGDDQNDGSQAKPWRTAQHGVDQLEPGQTLLLRGGVYHEQLYIALAGNGNSPITIRSYPGELAIIDGSFREFRERPAECWEPFPDGAPGEYRSTKAYRNVRHVLAAFADSMIGLQVYHNPLDLRTENEFWQSDAAGNVAPLYCGPGLWCNRETGRIHIRLAPTKLAAIGDRNYQGPSDPRDVPLVLAPFDSRPLVLDGAEFVRLQDLVVRGAGFDTVWIRRGQDVELDNVTVYCGTHGLRIETTVGLLLNRCAIRGQSPPWGFRAELKHSYWGEENSRDIVRLTGMILLMAEQGKLYRYPRNRDWEIAHCEFTDGHDGPMLGGVRGVRFHHNLVDNLHDDGVYLSGYGSSGGDVRIYENHFSRCLTTFAFGELTPANRTETGDGTWIYRNVFDLRGPVHYGRPTREEPKGTLEISRLCGDHGGPAWEPIHFTHNTVIGRSGDFAFGMAGHVSRPRSVYNNIFLHFNELPSAPAHSPGKESAQLEVGGNLHWSFRGVKDPPALPAWASRDRIADPQLTALSDDWQKPFDPRLQRGSPAINIGVDYQLDWPDRLLKQDADQPDVGAIPHGAEPFQPGRISDNLPEK